MATIKVCAFVEKLFVTYRRIRMLVQTLWSMNDINRRPSEATSKGEKRENLRTSLKQ